MNIFFVLAIIFFLAVIINSTVRDYVAGFFTDAWAFATNHAPTATGILAVIGILFMLPIILGISWIGLWAFVGSMALAPVAGLTIGILSLIGIFAFRKTIGIFLTIAFIAIVIGFCFPILKGAWNRYSAATQIEYANGLDNATLQKQPQGVLPAITIEDSLLYDNNGEITAIKAGKGKEVRTVSLERRQFAGNPETFVNIMLPNITGDYIGGSCGWIPVRKLKLGATVADESRKAEEAKRAEKAAADARTMSSADEVSRRELKKETPPVMSNQPPAGYSKFAEVDFGKNGLEKIGNPFWRFDLPKGEYWVFPAVPVKIGPAGKLETKQSFVLDKDCFGNNGVRVKPLPVGNNFSIVSIYRKEGG